MNDQLLHEVNKKLDRLLAILDGSEEGENEALFLYCIRENLKGNRKPLDMYGRDGRNIPQRFSIPPNITFKAHEKATAKQLSDSVMRKERMASP
jgi:hypothetical protein